MFVAVAVVLVRTGRVMMQKRWMLVIMERKEIPPSSANGCYFIECLRLKDVLKVKSVEEAKKENWKSMRTKIRGGLNFHTPTFGMKDPPYPVKSAAFLGCQIHYERGKPLYFKSYIKKEVFRIYWETSNILVFLRLVPPLGGTSVSCSLGTLSSVQGRLQRRSILFLVVFDRYELHLASCTVWVWVIHPSLQK